ncbi:MAG: MotA/TolQ/ExbB proton channel family protein [Planctomycetes bacterium]|nr:MotA/TolQ/ExbB proton channel family protein [Planctomycetota bacterium]
MDYKAIFERVRDVWQQAVEVWNAGGWAMFAIAVIALVMFSVGMNVWLLLRATRFDSVPERVWRRWIDHPVERRGRIGKMITRVTEQGDGSLKRIAEAFDQIRLANLVPFERDLKVMKVCVSAAPLVGLLGTVTGMLTTFSALATGGGGDQTMGMVAGGISEALITTETGLVVALPGLFFQYQLSRRYESYKAFLAHLESVCTQRLYRQQRRAEERAAHQAAMRAVAGRLRARLEQTGEPAPPAAPTTDLQPVHQD